MKISKIRFFFMGWAIGLMFAALAAAGPAAQEKVPGAEALRTGKNLLATRVYSEVEDQRLLALFKGLRVSDVADGMDAVGLQNIGLMDPEIHSLWRDTEHFTHRFVGIAVTARYVPTQDAQDQRRRFG